MNAAIGGSASTNNYLGVTPPISIDPPKPAELRATEDLVACLRTMHVFESEDESQRRERVLAKLSALVKDFVRRISLARKLPEVVANEAGGKIFTFGSYRLGVHGAGADIDTLCVVPKYVQREDFFDDFHRTLAAHPEVTELTAVPDSYVPVMKMCFDGIPIDLVLARLELSAVPENLELRDDNLLRNLDERCVRSLNGSRVTDEILRLVPSIPTFRTALRCIKLWAKKKAIYSNVMGFLGGVAWAMMVARVCQLYPNATAAVVVNKFFQIMGRWNWPQPILLKQVEDGPLQLYPPDRLHRMPVITPAYPSMCSTHNVTPSTLKIIMEELTRAAELTNRIMVGSAKWSDLFAKHDFFHRYNYYLQIIASSDSEDAQRGWSALVESRLRHLVLKLEFVENLTLAHPFMKGFDRTATCHNEQEAIEAGRGIFVSSPPCALPIDTGDANAMDNLQTELPQPAQLSASESATTLDKTPFAATTEATDTPSIATESSAAEITAVATTAPAEAPRTVYTTTFYIGLATEPKAPGDATRRKVDISWPTQEFTKMTKQWEQYNEKSMGLCIKYIKGTSLPTDVFDAGETRASKQKRSKTTSTVVEPKTMRVGQLQAQAAADPPLKKRRSVSSTAPEAKDEDAVVTVDGAEA